MARPRKEGMDYFPHDCNLSTDKKVEALRILHGNDGYVFFCIMLENIYQEPNFELSVSDAETIQILAKKVEVTPLKLEEMIKTAIKHGCFDRERYEKDAVLTSNGIKKRADVVIKKRVNMRDYHEKKVSGEVSDAETTEDSTQSKVKESKSKVKEKKDKEIKRAYAENVQLTESEYQRLIDEYGKDLTDQSIEYLSSYKVEKSYKTKSDNLTIRRWVIDATKKVTIIQPAKKEGVNNGGAQSSWNDRRGGSNKTVTNSGNAPTRIGTQQSESRFPKGRWDDDDVSLPAVQG